jgi:hypothetical protein
MDTLQENLRAFLQMEMNMLGILSWGIPHGELSAREFHMRNPWPTAKHVRDHL